tara:strand:+ start:10772 stop:11398 length:627 start_codon:yes stop_codon:yes gene_type:complete
MTDKFGNSGVSVVNKPDKRLEKATIIVLGPGRSGTSLVANLLGKSGVDMGDYTSATAEDLKMASILKNKNYGAINAFCDEKFKKLNFWGWKRPETINHLDEVDKEVISPVYICLFRDVFAIAKRNEVSMGRDVSEGIHSSLRSYMRMNNFIKETDAPLIMISFEKLKEDYQLLFSALSKVVEIDYTVSDNVLAEMKELKEVYLKTSRI